jgi:hypothetical protein
VAIFCEHGDEPSDFLKKGGYSLTRRVTAYFSKNILHRGVSLFVTKSLGMWTD